MISNRSLIFPLYLLFLLSIISCKKNNNSIENLEKIDISSNAVYGLKMSEVSKEYIENKNKIITTFYKKTWLKNNVSGSFLVAKNGQIIFENYNGYSSIEKKIKITATTPIHIASVSKVLTAAVILRLINERKLNLNQNINTLLKPFPYPNITIKTLLNHRSGLPNYAYFCDEKNIWNHSKTLTNQDVLDLLNKHHFPLQFTTDKRFAYCNTNYVILALVIEKITKMKYSDAMDKLLFKPLKMDNTFVLDVEKDKNTVSQSYKGNNLRLAFDHLDGTCGDKNIYSTPRDLLKFDLATYSPAFLGPKLVEAVYKGYSYENKGTKNYGLGIRMFEWETGQKMYYHNGWWHGNTSSYIKLKKDTIALFALSNKFTKLTFQTWKLAPAFGDYPFKIDKENESE